MKTLENKVIFLTGGTEGIGYECAKAYLLAGAKLSVLAIGKTKVAQLSQEIGNEHLCMQGDVSIAKNVKEAIHKTLEKFGKIDVIHNNAGIANPAKSLENTTELEWDNLINVNLKSIFYSTKFGIDALKRSKGCILNTSSLVGEIGQANHAVYAATKGAVNALTKSMAIDYAPFGIRVNAVSPAGVLTPMLENWINEQENPEEMSNYLDRIHQLGYCPKGDVIAEACVFLISDQARFITGTILPVSGGAELGYKL